MEKEQLIAIIDHVEKVLLPKVKLELQSDSPRKGTLWAFAAQLISFGKRISAETGREIAVSLDHNPLQRNELSFDDQLEFAAVLMVVAKFKSIKKGSVKNVVEGSIENAFGSVSMLDDLLLKGELDRLQNEAVNACASLIQLLVNVDETVKTRPEIREGVEL